MKEVLQIENRNVIKVRVSEIAYYLFWGVLFTAKGLGLDEGQRLFTFCLSFALLCFTAKICLTAHSVKEWIVMLSLLALGCAIWKNSGEKAAFWAVLTIIGLKDISLERLMKICLGIWSVAFMFSVITGVLHIRDGVVVVHEKLGLGPLVRWSLGYTHPNVLHVSYFILVALLLYVFEWHGKRLWKAAMVLFAGNLLVFLYSLSYTGILLVSGYLVLSVYLDARKGLYIWDRILFVAVAGAVICFPILGPLYLQGRHQLIFYFFNDLFSYRFEQTYNFFHDYPISLLGTKTLYLGNGHVTLDSSFAYLLMYYGIIGFVLFVAWLLYLVYRYTVKMRKKELALVLAIIAAGVTEQFLFNLSFKNLSLLMMGETLFEGLQSHGRAEGGWNRKYAILPFGERALSFPPGERVKEIAKKIMNNRRIFAAGIFGAFCGLLFCAITVERPNSVFVVRGLTDYRSEKRVTLDLETVPEDFNSLVIGYQGPETEMYEFTGLITQLEWIRSLMGYAVLGGLLFLLMGAFIYSINEYVKIIQERRNMS